MDVNGPPKVSLNYKPKSRRDRGRPGTKWNLTSERVNRYPSKVEEERTFPVDLFKNYIQKSRREMVS